MVSCAHSEFRIVGDSRAIRELLGHVDRVARHDATVLVSGETGTGKELVARAIHQQSRRVRAPLVAIDCAAIPPNLMESELFGHARGSFSGAYQDRIGRIEGANGGTVFLDEIGELDLRAQTRLLRVLEEHSVHPVGAPRPRQLDIRIIAATHRDLARMVREGSFREDLYFRLNVVQLRVPPLRERREDIPVLSDHFLRSYSTWSSVPVRGFTRESRDLLERYWWPGNVRQLENAIQSALTLAREPILWPRDFPDYILEEKGISLANPHPRGFQCTCHGYLQGRAATGPRPDASGETRAGGRDAGTETGFAEQVLGFQRRLILDALNSTGWDRSEAARRLQLTAHQIKYLFHKLDLERFRPDPGGSW